MPARPQRRRPLVVACVMAAMFMIAVESTIVSTAMPQIAARLGDLDLYSWVFAAFLLTQAATTVVFGKLADLYGRKPVILTGIAIFLVGSTLCGLAWSMPALIAFRLLQGVGAGAIQPICLTIVGDLFAPQERGRIQGWLASVWGVSSIAGPLAGGLIVGQMSWSWVFWINVPVGIAAAAGFVAFLHETAPRKTASVDVAGAALFAIAVAALMVTFTELGGATPDRAVATAGVFALSTLLFVLQERRAADPMLVIGLWMHRPIATTNAATLLSGMAIIGLTTFLPMYVQVVLGQSALVAGFALTAMILGWPIGSIVAARSFARAGLRATLLTGAALMPAGALAFVALTPDSSPWLAGAGSLVMGLGMGTLSTPAIIIIQECVGRSERGAVTAANIFARNLGSTLGATVLGGLLNLSLTGQRGEGAAVDFDQVRTLLEHPGELAAELAVRAALNQSLHLIFWAVFAIALLTFLLALLVPSIGLRERSQDAAAD